MIHQQPIPLVVQLLNLQKYHPEGNGCIAKGQGVNTLVWRQVIRPNELGALYSIELRYSLGDKPRVLVRSPDLRGLAGERNLPHIFEDYDGMVNLCLWKKGDWRPGRLLATTTIVWTAEWFLFFEQWLFTGEWLGGGTHPVTITPPENHAA